MWRIFPVLVAALLALPTPNRAGQGGYTAEMREWTSQMGRTLYGYHAAHHGVAVAAVRQRSGRRGLPLAVRRGAVRGRLGVQLRNAGG